jgi:membrane-bound lytic murein transglycosylase B
VVVLAVVGGAYAWPTVQERFGRPDPAASVPAPGPLPQAVPPQLATPPRTSGSTGSTGSTGSAARMQRPADVYSGWARQLSGKLDIPAVALQAYAYAQVETARTHPRCKLSWTLLAGIGKIESNHGRYGGASLLADGTSRPQIIGVPLNGSPGLMTIADTDGGRLDGDRAHDRAVGPMQFIPSTWARSGADANRDGREDPFNINDAALAAAGYLCSDGRDLTTSQGWTDAVLSYNHTAEYVRSVYGNADGYARTSLAG